MSKQYRYRDIPGFHGDTEEEVDLHHATPVRWTTKMTVWSVMMVMFVFILAFVVFIFAV